MEGAHTRPTKCIKVTFVNICLPRISTIYGADMEPMRAKVEAPPTATFLHMENAKKIFLSFTEFYQYLIERTWKLAQYSKKCLGGPIM
jgi:hypothetical protein